MKTKTKDPIKKLRKKIETLDVTPEQRNYLLSVCAEVGVLRDLNLIRLR